MLAGIFDNAAGALHQAGRGVLPTEQIESVGVL